MQQPKERVISDEEFRVMTDQNEDQNTISNLRDFTREKIRALHKIKPDYVFLNETSATPLGFVLKAAWKEAYPNEKCPTFYRVDPRVMPDFPRKRDGLGNHSPKVIRDPRYLERVQDFFRARIKKANAKVVVVDEYSESGDSLRAVKDAIVRFTGVNGDNIQLVEPGNRKFEQIFKFKYPRITDKKTDQYGCSPSGYRYPTEDISPEEVRFRGTMPDYKKTKGIGQLHRRYRSLHPLAESEDVKIKDYVHDLKLIGKLAGEEIRQGKHRSRELEQRVVLSTSIAGFLFSALFFSGITGNVIGATETKNIIVLISVLIGLTFGGIYLYLKKKK